MVDSFVSFSKPNNSMDIFPSFKNFHQTTIDQGAFTIDKRDVEEIQTNSPTASIQKAKKRNNVSSTNKTSSNPLAQCDICLVSISSQIVYDSHIKGKKHQTQLLALLAKNAQYKPMTYEELCSTKQITESEKPVVPPSESTVQETSATSPLIPSKKLNCNMCNVSCNSQQMFDNHIAGRKHQMKVKLNNFTSPAPPRVVPDNNPSSSNYCDMCSIKFNSEDELTEHLAQKRHQTRVKDAEVCVKEAADMNINFDDYKVSILDTEKNISDYQCTPCNKRFKNKIQLISHLKSSVHTRLSNPRASNTPKRGDHQPSRGSVMRGGNATRGQSFSSFRGSSKPSGKSRPYRSQEPSWNQSRPSFDQNLNQSLSQPEQTSTPFFGAFDQSNEANNKNSYPQIKRSTQYEENPNEYDRFYPKRPRTYNDDGDNSQNYYSSETNYYPSSIPSTFPEYPSNSNSYSSQPTNYNNPPPPIQPPWQNPTEPHYNQQPYLNSGSSYTNPMNYSSNQPPLPDYEPPPALPAYPPLASQNHYSQNSAYLGGTGNQGNNSYYQNSFQY